MGRYGTPESIAAAPGQILLDIDRAGGVACLTLNRPEKHNALSVPMRDRISDLMAALAVDDDVRVIVFRGRGKSFCSGNEINEEWGQRAAHSGAAPWPSATATAATWPGVGRVSARQSPAPRRSRSPVHGYRAAAAYFMICCKVDLVIAARDARLGALEARFLGPAGAVASVHINRIIGMKAARRTGFTATPMSGEQAQRLGLVSITAEAAELEAVANTAAGRIAARDRRELLYLKARLKSAEGLMDTSVPSITGLLVSHYLQADHDELDFWRTARDVGVGGALDADKTRTGAVDPRGDGAGS